MKKLLKTLLILILVGGAAAGGIYGYTRYTMSQPVQVQPVSYWLLEYSPNQTYLGGSVISGDRLILNAQRDRKPVDIYVEEGQTVKVGDPLLRYDIAKDTLALDEKLLSRQKLYDNLEALYREYKRYAYTDYERTIPTATPTFSPTPKATATPKTEGALGSALGVTRLSAGIRAPRDLTPAAGDGSATAPYQYTIVSGNPIPEALLMQLQNEANQSGVVVYATFDAGVGYVDFCFHPAPAGETYPRVRASFTVFETRWTAPRDATDKTPFEDKDRSGKGTSNEPFVYTYAPGREVSWTLLQTYIQQKNIEYVYVRFAGPTEEDLMVCLDFTSMGTYTLQLRKTPTCTVKFEANGGVVEDSSKKVTYGQKYGKLPDPTWEGHIFDGWWTTLSAGGEQIKDTTVVTRPYNHTLYARWKLDPNAPTPDPLPTHHNGGGMSRAERLAYAEYLAQQIRDDELQYRQLCHDIELLIASTGQNGTIYSTFNGVVATLNPQAKTGETLLEVRGGSGKNVIRCLIGETELTKYPLGTELTGYSYDLGENVTARVTYVGNMPVTDNYSNGGNPNSSGYIMLLEAVGDAELPLYSYVEFTSFEPLSKTGAIYLYEAFVREIDGQDCIFIVRDGYLKKVQVHTGRRTMEYIELVGSDLTSEDLIAFPYGKNIRDGAPVEVVEDLW